MEGIMTIQLMDWMQNLGGDGTRSNSCFMSAAQILQETPNLCCVLLHHVLLGKIAASYQVHRSFTRQQTCGTASCATRLNSCFTSSAQILYETANLCYCIMCYQVKQLLHIKCIDLVDNKPVILHHVLLGKQLLHVKCTDLVDCKPVLSIMCYQVKQLFQVKCTVLVDGKPVLLNHVLLGQIAASCQVHRSCTRQQTCTSCATRSNSFSRSSAQFLYQIANLCYYIMCYWMQQCQSD